MGNGLTIANRHGHGLRRPTLGLLIGVGALALSPQLSISTVRAQDDRTPTVVAVQPALANAQTAAAKAAQKLAKPYFIEFRARNAQSYGHTFSIFGRLDAKGKIIASQVAGLHPFTESPIPWMIGHLILVPSETGASDGDTEDQYVIARFRILLSADEYKKVTAFIKQLRDKSPTWHAVLYNCNAFVGDIAHFMGLKTPASTLSKPAEYIDSLRDLNIGRSDLARVIGTPVKVEDAATLRAAALRALEKRENPATPATIAHKQRTGVAARPAVSRRAHPVAPPARPAQSTTASATPVAAARTPAEVPVARGN
jgi:hypothetical protein